MLFWQTLIAQESANWLVSSVEPSRIVTQYLLFHFGLSKFLAGSIKIREMNKEKFDGTWVQTKSDNMDAILQKMGYSWPVRKIAGAMGLHLIINGSDRPGITTEFQTILKSTKMDLSFDHGENNKEAPHRSDCAPA